MRFTPVPDYGDDIGSLGAVVGFDTPEEVSLFEQLVRQHQKELRSRIAAMRPAWEAGLGPKGEKERTYFQLGMVDAWLWSLKDGWKEVAEHARDEDPQ